MREDVFFLLKSDPNVSSSEIARSIRQLPGAREVWMTEGEYSFIARFSAPSGAVPVLGSRISRNRGVVGLEVAPAPIPVAPMPKR